MVVRTATAAVMMTLLLAGCAEELHPGDEHYWQQNGCIEQACPARAVANIGSSGLGIPSETLAISIAPPGAVAGNLEWFAWGGEPYHGFGHLVWVLNRSSGDLLHHAFGSAATVEMMGMEGSELVLSVSEQISGSSQQLRWKTFVWNLTSGTIDILEPPGVGSFALQDLGYPWMLFRHSDADELSPTWGLESDAVVAWNRITDDVHRVDMPPLFYEASEGWSSMDAYLDGSQVLWEQHRNASQGFVTEIWAKDLISGNETLLLQAPKLISFFVTLEGATIGTDWDSLGVYGGSPATLSRPGWFIFDLAWDIPASSVFWSEAQDPDLPHKLYSWHDGVTLELGEANLWWGLWWMGDALVVPELVHTPSADYVAFRAISRDSISDSS